MTGDREGFSTVAADDSDDDSDDDGARVRPRTDDDVRTAIRRVEELTRVHGADDERTVAATEGLAMLHYARQETTEALPLMRRVTRSWAALHGPESATALRSRALLSTLLCRATAYPEALAEHEQVVADTIARSGAESRAGLASRYNHALIMQEAGDADGAGRLFATVAAQAARVLGPDDVVTRAAADQAG